jgi:outer membrane protein assembly factor BamB
LERKLILSRKSIITLLAIAALTPSLIGCTAGPSASPPSVISKETPPTSSIPAASSTLTSANEWTTYHRDLSRSGFVPGASPDKTVHRLWASSTLDGDIYSEPLVVGGKVLAATENNSVYALDSKTGKTLWQVSLGTPIPLSELSCGNIDPSGITGTPTVDPATGLLYVVARIAPNHHELFVLDTETGAIDSHRTIDPPGSNPKVQQQRGALVLANSRIYVPFGGLYGDCGAYYGWVVGVPVSGNGPLISYKVSSHTGAGFWAPSGPAADSAGNIYVTSGNAFTGSAFDFGNSVVRLSSDLTPTDWFAPSNWKALDEGDVDLGSMGPTLLQGDLIFQAGKEGTGYLLRANNLGHIGGEAFAGPVGGGAYGGAAYAPPYVFVPSTNGLVALTIDATPSFKVVWKGPGFAAGPPVVAGSTVLTVDIQNGTLYGFTIDKGDLLFKIPVGAVMHFTTPSLSGGNILVASGRQVISIGP